MFLIASAASVPNTFSMSYEVKLYSRSAELSLDSIILLTSLFTSAETSSSVAPSRTNFSSSLRLSSSSVDGKG